MHHKFPHLSIFNDLGSLTSYDELIINGTRITIPGGGVDATMNALLCQSGNGYKATTSAKDKQKAVRITSCTNEPLTFRDGCRGGAYKEVLDFHIVRSFSSGETRTNDAIVLPPTGGVVPTTYNANGISRTNCKQYYANYTRYLEDGTTVVQVHHQLLEIHSNVSNQTSVVTVMQ